MSSFHPSGAVIMARLLDALEVLHPEPELLVVPNDPRLAEFREQFAGMLVLFEERPDDLPEGEAGFAGSTRIVQTDDLFDELEEDPENRLELQELLRTRLLDILVGDRDRSVNNHLWARFEDGEGFLWRPIPRDRDQSFVQFDGFLKVLARQYDYRLVPFRDDYANTQAVTRNAWDIDRNLLVALDREAWGSTVLEVMEAVTDEVIRDAVSKMPPEHYAIIGSELEDRLRQRHQELPAVAEEFYDIVFRFADVHGTDVDEVALLEGRDDGSVRVALYRGDGSDEPVGEPHFDRTFFSEETREIRVYLHGGDDRVFLSGESRSSITLRVIGGGGVDELTNTSQTSVSFYDAGNRTVVEGPGVDHVEDSPSRPFSWFEESYDLDWGNRTQPLPSLSYDSDRGLMPIVGFQYTGFGFAKLPYSRRFVLRGGWAFNHSTSVVESSLLMREIIGSADLRLEGLFSGIEVVNFFGLGNETQLDSPDDFYKVDQEQLLLTATLGLGDGETWEANVGPVFKRVVSNTTGAPTFLSETRPPGTDATSQWGVQLGRWVG